MQSVRNAKICAMLTELIERLSEYDQTNSDVGIIIANALTFRDAIKSSQLDIPLEVVMGFSKFGSDIIDDKNVVNLLYDIDYFARFNQPRCQ